LIVANRWWLPIAIVGVLCLAARPGLSLPQEALESVVSVLPVWPGYERESAGTAKPGDEPEGTGVAIAPGGYLVTAFHVIDRAVSVTARLADGRVLPAKIVGRDPLTDLAVLKVAEDLRVPPLGPEPGLAAPVCIVGNQFGLGLSVTCGVVSALHRTGTGFNPIEDFIQTDAAANPGASGGALFDGEGRLFGVVSAIFTKEGDANIGVNFAASVRLVMRVVEDLIGHGRVVRGRSGLRVADIPEADRHRMVGAAIMGVSPGGSAERAGLKSGDVVTAIGDRAIRRASDVTGAVHMYRVGDRFDVTVIRDGTPRTLTMELMR
jgi:S1-C subfamily serine protease